MKPIALTILGLFAAHVSFAQQSFRLRVTDSASKEPLPQVSVTLSRQPAQNTVTDFNGLAVLQLNSADTLHVQIEGYVPIDFRASPEDTSLHLVRLAANMHHDLGEVVFVASTRSEDRIENAATKVEVLTEEELTEESTLKPGNISSMLGDVSGVQIQQSSAVSGNSNVRIQGLDGKYTQMLRDGMPMFGGFSGGFGVLSIPPLDLRQLELIKGSASTLYGGGAIAGLVNFISKRPGFDPEASLVLNGSTLKEGNLNVYYGQRWKKIGFTFFGGQTIQKQVDVDGDGLSDVPRLNSTLVHPTVFVYPTEKSSISLSYSGSFEQRTGGDMQAIEDENNPAHPYFERNHLARNTISLIAENRFDSKFNLSVKGIFNNFDRTINTNTYYFKGTQQNYYAEASMLSKLSKHTLITGVNFTGDNFRPSDETPVPVGTITNNVAGVFIQDAWQMLPRTRVEAGLRLDHHQTYGTFFLPRLAIFHRLNEHWGLRGGLGMGYTTPNPLAPQTKDFDIGSILPISSSAMPERSFGANLEGNYRTSWDEDHKLFINHAFFLTQINDPSVGYENAQGDLAFYNADKPVVTAGFDTYVQMELGAWEAYLGYTYTDARRQYLPENNFVPLTPHDRAASTLVYTIEGLWRFGVEASYFGPQYRDGDSKTPQYFFVAAMIERKFGPRFSLVLNCENLLDERQTRYEQIYTGSIEAPVYKALWAPIDGRVTNLAFQFKPFAK